MKKIITITITVLILTSSFLVLIKILLLRQQVVLLNSVFTRVQLVSLQITVHYNCIFVQLQDSSGQPARALQDTTISLSSSLTNIGTVDPSIIISKRNDICVCKLQHHI